jgi:hypothetical protein
MTVLNEFTTLGVTFFVVISDLQSRFHYLIIVFISNYKYRFLRASQAKVSRHDLLAILRNKVFCVGP